MTMSLGGEGPLPMSGEGVFDTKNNHGEMTMTMDLSSLTARDAEAGGYARVTGVQALVERSEGSLRPLFLLPAHP